MIRAEHEIHTRRKSRNVGVGLILATFALIVFGLSAVKITNVGPQESFDHVVRPALAVEDN